MEKKKNLGVKKTHINKNKIRTKNRILTNFRDIVPGIVDYLKSDSYFYSHLMVSSSAPSDYAAQHDVFFSPRDCNYKEMEEMSIFPDKPILELEDSMKEKLVEYLKSDTYLYAPLEGTQHRDDFALKTAISPPRGEELQFTRVTSTVVSKKVAWQTKKVAENSVVEKRKDHGLKGALHDASVISPETPALQEAKKQATRRSSRLSTPSG